MKTPYNLSKDYTELYTLICEGLEIACFLDYDFYRDGSHAPVRDIAKIKRHDEFSIQIGVRGIQYGGVDPWHKERNNSELEAFIKECTSLNLEWISYITTKPNDSVFISCGTGQGEDFSIIIEAMKESNGKIMLVSGLPKDAFSIQEVSEKLKQPEPLIIKKLPELIDPYVHQKQKRTNHERQPANYKKQTKRKKL